MTVMSNAAAFWGCDDGELLDVWNCARTLEYVRKYMPQKYQRLKNCCPDFASMTSPAGASPYNASLPTYLGQTYNNPIADGAWWADSSRPESAAFFGFHVTSVGGRMGDSLDVTVSQGNGCGGSNIYRVSNSPQILTVEAVAYGATCCSIAYGVRALRRLLTDCGCGNNARSCSGTQMTLHDCNSGSALADNICIPPGDSFVVPAGASTTPWRLFKNAKLIEMPQIVESRGNSCGGCGCSDNVTVSWTIATDPGAYLDVVDVMPPFTVHDPAGPCVVSCDPRDCVSPEFLRDPSCPTPIYIAPGDTPTNCFCKPVIRREKSTEMTLATGHFLSELEFEVTAGSEPLRNLEIRLWKKVGASGYGSGLYDACNADASFTVAYIPANGTLRRTISGVTIQTGATVYDGGSVLGGPNSGGGDTCIRLDGGTYIVASFTDPYNTGDAAAIEISAREFEP